MEKYKLIALLTCYGNKDSVQDNINNIKKFNDDVCIIINDGTPGGLEDLASDGVYIVKRKPFLRDINNNPIVSTFEKFDTIIPLHIDLCDFILENNLVSDHIVLLSSNQLFIDHGFSKLITEYDASYYERDIDTGCIPPLLTNNIFTAYFNDLGMKNFKVQSNHDGMFFKYDIFMNMIRYYEHFRNLKLFFHAEEFLYPAFLFKSVEPQRMVTFEKYNYWRPNWRFTEENITVDDVKEGRKNGLLLVKRVPNDYNDDVRKYLREVN